MKSLEEVRAFFAQDKYATETTGIVIEDAHPGYAKVSLRTNAGHRNAVGQIMGAVFFTMADFAFAVATNYEYDEALTVTLSSQCTYLSVARGDVLYAETQLLRSGNRTSFYDILVTDEFGTLVAKISTNGYRINRK